MRSIPLLAVSTVVLAAAWACGGGSDVGPNTPPVAAFTVPTTCTPTVLCQFTDASTDADGTISSRAWDFGDPTSSTNTSTDASPNHTFAAAGTYSVKLTVTDNSGATGTVTNAVTVGVANVPPTAIFTLPPLCTAGTPCGFHSTSTDADGSIATTHWDFGDQESADGADQTHTYAAAGAFTVTLTVTDDKGATGTATQQLTVSPTASQDCTTSVTVVDCSLGGITRRVTVKITIVSTDCELAGDKLTVTPVGQTEQTAFFNLCNRTVGEEYTVQVAGGGAALVFQPGSTVPLRFHQGVKGPNDPPTGDPGIRVTGSFPNWTLNIDDGGAAGSPGEPDFNDVVLSVQATNAP
jgi:PKD repeat protein